MAGWGITPAFLRMGAKGMVYNGLPEDMQLFNTQQVAERLGVSSRSVLRWIQNGKLEGQKLGPRQYRVSKEALDKFLDRTKEETRMEASRKGAE